MSEHNVTNQERDAGRDEAALLPPVDVIEDAEGITLYADLPGVPKDKISVRVEAGTLTVEGEVRLAATQGIEVTHAEVQLPRFRRAFTLGPELNTEKVDAEFRQGVLKLRIPKAEHAKPRRIEVQVS
jgi:HSP20 family protein